MGFSGRLEGIAPSDIFQIISQSRMTGTLIARCPDGTAMVVFKNGQVIEAASDAPQESLGHLLVSQGVLSERTIEAARELRKQEPDRPLGAILVDMGAISGQALQAVVLKQIGQIVHRLIACDDGFITFDRGEVALKRKLNTGEFYFPSGLSTEYLIMERARVVDEERRKRPDRRVRTESPPVSAAPAEGPEAFSASAALRKLAAWSRSASGTVVRRGKQLAGSSGDLYHRSVAPRLRSAAAKVRAFSPDGRTLILAGLAGIATGIALILLTTLTFQTPGTDLSVTGRVVNIRSRPSTAANVVAKASRGEMLTPLASREGWDQVRTKEGATGWVLQKLVVQKEKKGLSVNYHMKGFELVVAAGFALLVTGIMRHRKAAVPRILREVK